MASLSLLAAVAVALLLSGLVSGKKFDIVPGWRAINNGSLDKTGGDGGPSYRILRAGEDPIVSENGSFSLAFYAPRRNEEYYLTVLLHPGMSKPAPAPLVVPIWTANSSSTLSETATLMLTSTHKKFILLDSGGSLEWSSGGVVGIAGMDLEETGNLVFYGKDGKALWQSFEHPTDVLVPGQSLRQGISLSSSGGSNASTQFRGTMEASGFVLYAVPETVATMADMLRKPQPYQVWSIDGSRKLDSALRPCRSSVMSITDSGIEISSSGRDCGNRLEVYGMDRTLAPASGYWRLEQNGDFVLREFHETEQNWQTVFALSSLSNDSCKHPTACGRYGFCTTDGKCRCVGNDALDDQISDYCSPPSGVSVSCVANEAINHHFVEISSATYFSNRFATPDVAGSSLEDCSAVCAANCSCAAAFFSHRSRACFLVDEVMGSLSSDPDQSDYTALIKIQNAKLVTTPMEASSTAGRGMSRSARTAIVLLAVLCGVLAVIVAVGIYVIKTRYPHAYNKMMRRA